MACEDSVQRALIGYAAFPRTPETIEAADNVNVIFEKSQNRVQFYPSIGAAICWKIRDSAGFISNVGEDGFSVPEFRLADPDFMGSHILLKTWMTTMAVVFDCTFAAGPELKMDPRSWNFFQVGDCGRAPGQLQAQAAAYIMKNLSKKPSGKRHNDATSGHHEIMFSTPEITCLWGFWVTQGNLTSIDVKWFNSKATPPQSMVHHDETVSPMSDYYSVPCSTKWSQQLTVKGHVIFTPGDEDAVTLSDYMHQVAKRSKLTQLSALSRHIDYQEYELNDLKVKRARLQHELEDKPRGTEALGASGESSGGCGIKRGLHAGRIDGCFRFASPGNQAVTGYSIMVGCERFDIVDEEVSNDPRIKTFRVTFWQGDKSPLTSPHSEQTFLWQLSLQQQNVPEKFVNCWMTDAVVSLDIASWEIRLPNTFGFNFELFMLALLIMISLLPQDSDENKNKEDEDEKDKKGSSDDEKEEEEKKEEEDSDAEKAKKSDKDSSDEKENEDKKSEKSKSKSASPPPKKADRGRSKSKKRKRKAASDSSAESGKKKKKKSKSKSASKSRSRTRKKKREKSNSSDEKRRKKREKSDSSDASKRKKSRSKKKSHSRSKRRKSRGRRDRRHSRSRRRRRSSS
ncbi:unnamed protein product [Symbiodinium sp. KB8]|nr:unnamed protein product [Symbiodinium sp. KB8]